MSTVTTIELEMERRTTEVFLDEIYGMIKNDDIERVGRRVLTVARDIGGLTGSATDFITPIIIAINNFNEIRRNRQLGTVDDDKYFAQKNQCLSRIIGVVHGLADELGARSKGQSAAAWGAL
jgi:hypothetical protein